MNKRGFTLIEMLAVIVLLGLLMAFLFPAVTKYIIQTRDNTYTLYEADMKTAAQNMMNECVEENKANCIPAAGSKKRITLSELVSTGYTERLKDPKKESEECDPFQSFVTVGNDNSNVTNLTYDVCLVCGEYSSNYCGEAPPPPPTGCTVEEDTAPPVCGVAVGASDIWTNKDREIIIGCSDDCTGCVQDTFTKVVNTDTKTTTIDIADNAGKVSSCTVDAYVDKTKPTCTLTVTGVVGDNGWYKAGTRPKVTLTVTGKDDEGKTDTSGIATYGIGTSRSNYDFNKETEYLVEDGITTVYGYVKDNAGNVGVCHTEEIRYDSVIPTIDTVDYGTVVYPKPDIATKSGSTITLNDITSEYGTIVGFYVYMNNGTGGRVRLMKSGEELASVTIPTSTSKARNGIGPQRTYTNLSFVFDSATEANNVSRIELLTRDDTVGYYTNQNVTLYINSLDSVSGKANYSFDNGNSYQSDNFKTYTQNTLNIRMKASDYSGNTSGTTAKNITNIDKVQPKCTVTFGSGSVTVHENNYFWANVPVTLTKDDNNATSAYAKSNTRYYGLKDSSGLAYNNTATGTQTSDTTGHVWYGYVIDKAGNTIDCNSTVKKDTQDPTCTLTKSGSLGEEEWYSGNVTISFSAKGDVNKDGSQSGLAYYLVNTSSGNPSSWGTSNSNTQTTDTYGQNWYGHVKDYAGHTATCSTSVKRDSVAPSCSIDYRCTYGKDNWCVSDVYVKLGGYGDVGSVQSGLSGWGIQAYNGLDSMTMQADTTGQTMTGYVRDKAGNECTDSTWYKRDVTGPTCTVTKTAIYYTDGINVHFDCSDATSGFDRSSMTYFYGYEETSTKPVYDLAGNESNYTFTVTSGTRYRKRTCNTHNSCVNNSCTCASGHYNYTTESQTFTGLNAEARGNDYCNAALSWAECQCACTDTNTANQNETPEQSCHCTRQKTRSWVCDQRNSCVADVCSCATWNAWDGSDTYYPNASCAVTTSLDCKSATVYW